MNLLYCWSDTLFLIIALSSNAAFLFSYQMYSTAMTDAVGCPLLGIPSLHRACDTDLWCI